MQTWIHGEYSHTDNSPLVHHRTENWYVLLLNILYFSVFSFSTHINTGIQYWEQTGLDKAHPRSDSGTHCASEGGAEGAHPHPQILHSQAQGSQIQPQASETSLFLLEYFIIPSNIILHFYPSASFHCCWIGFSFNFLSMWNFTRTRS